MFPFPFESILSFATQESSIKRNLILNARKHLISLSLLDVKGE